jgi:hypothetical protein
MGKMDACHSLRLILPMVLAANMASGQTDAFSGDQIMLGCRDMASDKREVTLLQGICMGVVHVLADMPANSLGY